jgi:hypothetical protein
MANWRDLERDAPQIARPGLARLHAAGVAMVGTPRRTDPRGSAPSSRT